MKKCKMNKIISGLIALMMMLCLGLSVSAETIDQNRLGSIHLTLRDQMEKAPVAGAEITIYAVATTKTEGNLEFVYTEEFQNCGSAIEDYYKTEFAEEITNYIADSKIQGIALVTNDQGVAHFADLTQGIYLVAQTKTAEGFSAFAPFVVQLPITQDSRWVYDIDVTPKADVIHYTDITAEKVWNDDGNTQRPDSIKIQLLRGGEVVDTVTLSQENGWKHTWKNLIQGDDYTVKELDVPKGYKATYKQNGFYFTVTNTATLAQTGQLNWPIPVLILSGLVLIAAGYVLIQRGKRYE